MAQQTEPIFRIAGWLRGLASRPFDCQVCGEHVPSGKRVGGRFRACSEACADELWQSHQV